jgi:Outer membrane protein beta-barrel domain
MSPKSRLKCGRTLEQGEALKRSLFLAIVTIALVAAPRVSEAQLGLVKPFQLGIAGGAAQPMSDLSDGASTGYNGTVAMAIQLPFIPVGLRIDGAYNQFGEKAAAGAKLHVMSATGNVVWRLPSIGISPYLIGGAGLYMQSVTPTGASALTENHLGWNAGAGVNLPVSIFKAFVEARYNSYSTDTGSVQFVPLTVGIMF